MRASALVLLALGGALAFSSAPADPRESRTDYGGSMSPCADGSYLDCTDSPAMLIGGHSADAGDHSEVDTSLDESYLGQGKRCVRVEAYNGCIQKRTESPLCGGATWHDCDEATAAMEAAACRVPCYAECLALIGWDSFGRPPTSCEFDPTDELVLDAFCAKHRGSSFSWNFADVKYKGPLPDDCCAQDEDVVGTENDPCKGP